MESGAEWYNDARSPSPWKQTMTVPQPRYTKEEHASRGSACYEQQVRPQVESGNQGRIVALEVDTGHFEIADDSLTASQRLLPRVPNAQIWCVRIGQPAVHHVRATG